MNANNMILRTALALVVGLSATTVFAEQGLNAHSQTKVNNAKAKAWSTQGNANDQRFQKSVVNIGSKRAGTCDVNVGTVQKGQKAPKEIVVATKEVINVCK